MPLSQFEPAQDFAEPRSTAMSDRLQSELEHSVRRCRACTLFHLRPRYCATLVRTSLTLPPTAPTCGRSGIWAEKVPMPASGGGTSLQRPEARQSRGRFRHARNSW